jgi:hypothetical protein
MACLEDVERAAHVALGELEERCAAVGREDHAGGVSEVSDLVAVPNGNQFGPHLPFPVHHIVDLAGDLLLRQRREAEPRATRLDRGGDFVDVVAQNGKADVFGVLFNDWRRKCEREK